MKVQMRKEWWSEQIFETEVSDLKTRRYKYKLNVKLDEIKQGSIFCSQIFNSSIQIIMPWNFINYLKKFSARFLRAWVRLKIIAHNSASSWCFSDEDNVDLRALSSTLNNTSKILNTKLFMFKTVLQKNIKKL